MGAGGAAGMREAEDKSVMEDIEAAEEEYDSPEEVRRARGHGIDHTSSLPIPRSCVPPCLHCAVHWSLSAWLGLEVLQPVWLSHWHPGLPACRRPPALNSCSTRKAFLSSRECQQAAGLSPQAAQSMHACAGRGGSRQACVAVSLCNAPAGPCQRASG